MKTVIKTFVIFAFLFSLVLLSAHFTTVQAQGGSWKLKETRVFNNMPGNIATVTSERYDASGGIVDVQLSGDILSFCPGGYEKMRFTWNFANNATTLTNGGGVSVSLDARQVSKSQNCGTQLASRSLMYVYPGSFNYEGSSSVDRDRFKSTKYFRAFAAEGENSGIGELMVQTYQFDPKQPLAYFEICIGTPTRSGGGSLCYAYMYEGSSAGGGGGSLGVEYDTDRMGGDYKDYDLPRADFELCRSACANDSQCRAYTYVKPGVQSASARCWLKSSVPGAGSSSCCISGIKSQGRAALTNKLWPLLLGYEPIPFFQDGDE